MKALQVAATLAIAASVFAAKDASAQQTVQQVVSYEVAAVDQITVTGSPSLVINSATAGSALNSATASGTYAVTTNGTNRKITAAIDTNMPAGVTLTVALGAPTGGNSSGTVTLTSVAQDVVTNITTVNESGLSISYGLSADITAGVIPAGNKTVSYTITAGA